MRNPFFITSIIILFTACHKDKHVPKRQDGEIVSINDTIQNPNNYYIDVDEDDINDFKIKFYSHWGTMSGSDDLSITPLNDYEIFTEPVILSNVTILARMDSLNNYVYDSITHTIIMDTIVKSINTITVPKMYSIGDTIISSHPITKEFIFFITYDYYDMGINTSYSNQWSKAGTKYVGYRKLYGKTIKIGWFKINVLDVNILYLSSWKVSITCNELVIDN